MRVSAWRRSAKGVALALTAAFVVSFSGDALAQQPTAADRETARSLMDEGDKKRDSGDMKAALKAYEGADAIMKVPSTGIEVARAQVALGLLIEARETLNRVQRTTPKSNEPAPFAAARKAAAALNDDLATRVPSMQLSILNGDPAQTPQVVIDGENVPAPAAQAPRKMNPGHHTVIVRSGTVEKRQEITLVERDGVTITIDLAKGRHIAKADKTDKTDKADKTTPAPEKNDGSAGKYLMYGGFGVAVIGVGVGAVTGVLSITKTNDLKGQCPNNACPVGKQADIDSATGLGNLSTVAFVVGGIGAAVGIIGIIISPSSSDSAPAAKKESAFRLGPGSFSGTF